MKSPPSLAAGGMGQVYQATDTKLNRQVAVKILPEAFAADPDRLARFQREAQLLAILNHPGIAAIYGIEVAEDTHALVSPCHSSSAVGLWLDGPGSAVRFADSLREG